MAKSKGKTALKRTGRALKSAARGILASGAEILGAGAMALNPRKRRRNRDYPYWNIYHIDTKKSSPYDKTFLGSSSFGMTKAEAIEKFRRSHYPGRLRAGTKIVAEKGIISTKNPYKRLKVRNKYIDLVIKGQAKKTPQGWKVGQKTFAQGRGTTKVSSNYYLDRSTGLVYAKRERNTVKKAKKKAGKRNASRVVHPSRKAKIRRIRAVNKTGRKSIRTRSKQKRLVKRKASQTARTRSRVSTRKATTSRLVGRAIKKSSGLLKGKRRNLTRAKMPAWIKTAIRQAKVYGVDRAGVDAFMHASKAQRDAFDRYLVSVGHPSAYEAGTQEYRIRRFVRERAGKRQGRRNPSAESIRKKFAGRVSGERDVFVPSSAPQGKLAKLGRLVLIETEKGTIKPVHGSAVLLADTRGKLHIGSLSGADLIDGPARSFGKVKKIEYDESKPHLGYGPTIWFHKMGEESGHRPTLHADGKGGLVFRGGRYRLTRRGIEN